MKKNQTIFLKLCLADALLEIMESRDYSSININAVCAKAGVGRTTFYRHCINKSGKEELLKFKIIYEWECYIKKHDKEFAADKTFTLLNFVYENRKMFTILNDSGVILIIIPLFEYLLSDEYASDKASSYLKAFFIYGQFGAVYQWIKYGFDETPEQIGRHIMETIVNKVNAEA